MKHVVAVLLIFAVGCFQPPLAPRAVAVEIPVAPPPRQVSRAEVNFDSLDFAKWPTATEDPINVKPHVAYACSPGIISDRQRWNQFGGEKRHGPHAKHAIVVRVNTEAMEAFKIVGTPLPVGTVVIKEKHPNWSAAVEQPVKERRGPLQDDPAAVEKPVNEFGAMIKREPGYDPENGDWEYAYVVRGPAKQLTRGKLASCIDCHSHMKDRDYLFRTYLPGQVEGAQKRHPAVSEW